MEHVRYLAARTQGEDDFLRDLKRAAQEAGIPPIWIAPEQASLMQILLRLTGARDVVEVGTLAGYSAIAMARALPPEGRVRTIEIDAARADFAESWVARSDVADKVQVLRGSGATMLATLADASADAAFLDADKGGYASYLEECRRIVRPGGLVLADNAFAFGRLFEVNPHDQDVNVLRAFNDHVAAQPWLQGIIVPVGDGLWVCVKLRS
jgi:predicted O-methyltransferase YrrM